MAHHQPFQVTGFHSCDREIGLNVLNGNCDLRPSHNPWDWLSDGIYFWELNPLRALEYANESAVGQQYNKTRIKTPFVLGAIIELGNCLNLVESQSLSILTEAYTGLAKLNANSGTTMPVNKDANRALDCAVLRYVSYTRQQLGKPPYDTIRCAFDEGVEVYPGASFTSRHHIQICVINPEVIKGYFLPRPLTSFNPNLRALSFEL